MLRKKTLNYAGIIGFALAIAGCAIPPAKPRIENKEVPQSYFGAQNTVNSATSSWKELFNDQDLIGLIDTALRNNQELNISLQEILISRNEVRARKGEYLPFVNVFGTAGGEKVGRYTSQGANDANTEIKPGRNFPDPLGNFSVATYASWELDIWKKLRNAKKAAVYRYLGTVEGRNFMITNLVAEIAGAYYELLAFDNQLIILKSNIEIQQNALEIVKLEKIAAKVTELAVRKFEAEVLKNQSRQYYIEQNIIEAENRINFLVGRFPKRVQRNSQKFIELLPNAMNAGIPSQLLANRPDIKQAELQLMASKLDVSVARANFYPSLRITAGLGLRAFNPAFLTAMPESILYSIGADMIAPLINRNAIKANYYSANSMQIQAVYNYERSVLNGYIEVYNQVSMISNLEKSFALKTKQVDALIESNNISGVLFRSARADYMEVLLTQRDALDARFELIDTKMQQLHAVINIYQALGGGWK